MPSVKMVRSHGGHFLGPATLMLLVVACTSAGAGAFTFAGGANAKPELCCERVRDIVVQGLIERQA